jgi:cell division protein ZapA (FtsZ GTPase activity inhibitor)
MAERGRQIKAVSVQILGEEIPISVEDPAELQRVTEAAEYVRRKERELLAHHGSRLPKNKMAVLVAMEIANELFLMQKLVKTQQEKLADAAMQVAETANQRINRMTHALEQLKEAATLDSRTETTATERYRPVPLARK